MTGRRRARILPRGPVTGVAVFSNFPGTVNVTESAAPGTIVCSFTVSCVPSNSTLNVSLTNISPSTSFFNPVNYVYNGSTNIYDVQVSLSPGASFDARVVNQYVLTFSAQCPPEKATEKQLFLHILPLEMLECNTIFADLGLEEVQVPENIDPETVIYVTVLKRRPPPTVPLNYTFANTSEPFTITQQGKVLAPTTGFSREQAGKTFFLDIVVTDGRRSCHRHLTVKVLPVYHNKVNFTKSFIAVSVLENGGALQNIIQVNASGDHVRYQIIAPLTNDFTIEPETGIIKNTFNLNLQLNPDLAQTQLLVKAYNMLHPEDSAIITVNITVQQQNLHGPSCNPAVFVTEVPENYPPGRKLIELLCWDAERGNNSLVYRMEDNQSPQYSFRMDGSSLLVNTTLDCDSQAMVNLQFSYQATILVSDRSSPLQTTRVPVLVTVSRVNEYQPECSQHIFYVKENAHFGDPIGNINGTDRDYPFNNIEYSILGGENGPFYIGRRTGELFVLGPLDYEKLQSYRLFIMLKDLDNDVKPEVRKSSTCNVTINVQDVNDEPPECEPSFGNFVVCSRSTLITQLNCKHKDQQSDLAYSIVGGNINGRFRMDGDKLLPNTLSFDRTGVLDPPVFELLVKVTYNRGTPELSTTVTIIVSKISCTTTVPTTTTTTTTVTKKPIILHRTEEYWAPDPWFVVVLTLTGVLFLSALALLFWRLCWRNPPEEISQPLLQNRGKGLERNYIMTEEPSKEKGKGSEVLSLQHQFDGRAQDPVTGQYYLFDSSSGARRWV
ncbi:cadherin-related family member 4 [Tiliqua scincoides]|uniref:cadherin-related family member 4 n=1 Tax=Tiliqua scincoides TaxID=71010 RepID=UPI0034619D92